MDPPDLTNNRVFAGAMFIVAAELMFALMGASIRQVSTELNSGMVVFVRNLVGLLLLTSVTAHPGHRDLWTRQQPRSRQVRIRAL